MKYGLFKERVLEHLQQYKEGTLKITESGVWPGNGNEYPHILPKHLRHLNFLPTVRKPPDLKEHRFSHHLNSSQVMCVNFFEPLLHTTEGNTLLLQLVGKETGFGLPPDTRIKKAVFEFEPCKPEGTNFDFYIELSGGENISFEIKYTEQAFGGLHPDKNDPDKYNRKWRDIYIPHLRNSLYLKDFSEGDFYKHYQIWRNVSFVKKETDYVIFLIPYENGGLYAEVEQALDSADKRLRKNLAIVDWRSIVSMALDLSQDAGYHRHFRLFKEKYLEYPLTTVI